MKIWCVERLNVPVVVIRVLLSNGIAQLFSAVFVLNRYKQNILQAEILI
jgi:hypothetical protein